MQSLRIREIPKNWKPLKANISPGRCKLENVNIELYIDVLVSIFYSMT